MTKTRAVTITALVAASALALAACGNTDQAGTNTPPAATSNAATSGNGASSSDTGAPPATGSGGAGSGTATAASSGGSSAPPAGDAAACGKPHGAWTAPASTGGTVNVSFNEGVTSWNGANAHSNSSYNSYPANLTQANIQYYDDQLVLNNNDAFVTCKKVDDSTYSYTVNKAAKWSDGVPVTAADMFLAWAAQGGAFNTGAAETDDAGNLLKSDKIAFDTSSEAFQKVKEMPKVSDDGLTITMKYSEFFVDTVLNPPQPQIPAHVVAMHALGETDATTATNDLMAAFAANFKDKKTDGDKIKKIADFWNTGFDFTELPSDKSLYLSDGAYLMTDYKKDQYMTFELNPDYNWGPKPSIKQITYKILPDAMGSVQALQNGEVDVINPQPTADVLGATQKLKNQGIETQTGDGGTYEHVDLAVNNKGPFDPAAYGGDKDKALKVRQAFLKTIPREDIVNKLIKPLNPNATLRQSFNIVPGSPRYDAVVAANGSKDWTNVDIEGAKKLLADAGVSAPKVRFMYADKNARRANEYKLIAASASQAGFQMVDGKNPDWASQLPNTKIYDAALFGWQSTNTGVSQISPNFTTKQQNNFYGYSNAESDKALKTLNATAEVDKQTPLIIQVEKNLFADAFGTVIFQFPDLVAFNSKKIAGVKQMPLSPGYFWNYWEWTVPAA